MMSDIDLRLKNKNCDVCQKPATRWFRETCVILCDDFSCFEEHEKAFQQNLEDLAKED
jgi:hypothetical protein